MLELIGRHKALFEEDFNLNKAAIVSAITEKRVLILGGAGTIGQAVVKLLCTLSPAALHVVDISENNLAELVRDVRSSFGFLKDEFQTWCLDIGSPEYDAFIAADGKYDFIFNLSALKHVRSEKDPFTLMRMLQVNVLNTQKTLEQASQKGCKKYFAVSTDKATSPVNLMGASKLLMERCIMNASLKLSDAPRVSTARFANVAFSDGSLLHSFRQRLIKRQPIAVPDDIKRYFVTPEEAGLLCVMSAVLGKDKDIFYPIHGEELVLTSMVDVATAFLSSMGLEPYFCHTEEQARELINTLSLESQWPCLLTQSDTSGEKPFEEFYESDSILDEQTFQDIGIVKSSEVDDSQRIDTFISELQQLRENRHWTREALIQLFQAALPDLHHQDTGKFLDSKM